MIFFAVIALIFLIFRPWFLSPILETLSSGDWPYLFAENIKAFSWIPQPQFLWLAPYYQVVTKFFVETLGIHWHLIERLLWFWPWILISFFSAKKFTNSVLGGLIYTTNTYALMLVGGGQMGVAMAYALAPLILKKFKVYSTQYKDLVLNGLLLAVQAMFDPRVTLLTIVVAVLYWVIVIRKKLKTALSWFGMPLVIAALFHIYWWVPLLNNLTLLTTQFQEATSDAVKYLSFASFSNAFSLLHPNWPENIFGKIYFQKPEFLVIPILAFASLLFIKQSKERLFFALLSLVGAFLAKGINEPFGGIYLWLFEHVPGFSLFRDPTKFYLFIALGYSVLIPFTLSQLATRLKHVARTLVPLVFLLFWALSIREALMGSLTGTFRPIEVPVDYVRLKDVLITQPENFQTGWYPKKSRFSFSGNDYQTLKNIRYVAIPVDVRGEIFVTDRMYDESKHLEAISFIATMSGLRRVDEYKDIAVFEVIR